MSLILMTTLFYKALILHGEIWRWSLLGLKGLKSLKSLSTVFYFLQAKSEFSSTEEIVQTIQTMTANLAKVSNLYPIIHLASTLQKQMVFI